MDGKKLLKKFYLIADELDKNILKFNELEEKLEVAKKNNDVVMGNQLLEEYKIVADNIKKLKELSNKLKEEN